MNIAAPPPRVSWVSGEGGRAQAPPAAVSQKSPTGTPHKRREFMFAISQLQTVARSLSLLCLAGGLAAASADLKIKSKNTSSGSSTESTTYIKGKRQRTEHNPMMATITQCDLRRSVDLGLLTKTYVITPYDQKAERTEPAKAADRGAARPEREPVRRGGVVTMTVTTTDTGERKQMFGYTARHIKTATAVESSPEACNQTKTRMETDGWYIDFAYDFNCGVVADGGYQRGERAGGCRDEFRTKQIGAAKLGYPVLVTTTMFDESGKQSFTFTQEVVEISKATLDAALFEIPADFTEVQDRQQMFGAAAMTAAAKNAANDGDDTGASSNAPTGLAANAQQLAAAKPAANGANGVGPKKQGVVRVGVALPRVSAVGDGMNSQALAEAVRNTFVSYLNGPALEVVMLDARLAAQAEAEARQKDCDFIVSADVAHKKGASFGGFLKKAAPVMDVVPYGGSTAGAVTTTAARVAVYTAADLAASVKAKDELTLDYRLQAANGGTPVARTLKAKAKSDGEDIISNTVEQAAGTVLAEASRK
jgi:hypothetical protein